MKIFTTMLALALLIIGVLDIVDGSLAIGIVLLVLAGVFGAARKSLN